jgi:acetyl-CoA/propionyl-CoA carboxylase biotin carboxyl carrier protein
VSWSAKLIVRRIRCGVALFRKVLVANRGEIAVRVVRALRELGIGSVGVYAEADAAGLHVRAADEALLLPGGYLDVEGLLAAAQEAGAEAIHPGYGFLAENAGFARACADAGLVFVGPPPDAIEAMGSKIASRERMRAAGVPVVPGTTAQVTSPEEVVRLGAELGWPLAIKASAGGGGKGLRVVSGPDEVERAFATARREGESYFADATVYVERFLDDPRHVEVQILADTHGNVIHLGERDCTIQRRHQKLVEETPSPAVSEELRARIGAIAVDAARAVGYRSAGTIEGLLSKEGEYFFLEMNTRIQVEHTVTELVTGIDLVREQLRIAAGEPLSIAQEDVVLRGHAIECRINAEDVAAGFRPGPGRIRRYREPAGPGVRVDSGVAAGSEVSELYDPLIAKLCVVDVDREAARLRMLRALGEYVVEGVPTLVGFHRALLETPEFAAGETCRDLVESPALAARAAELVPSAVGLVESAGSAASTDEPPWAELARRRRSRVAQSRHGHGEVVSPIQGTVLSVEVADGDHVEAGQLVCVVEAMKMENEVHARAGGTVSGLAVTPGAQVRAGELLCVID